MTIPYTQILIRLLVAVLVGCLFGTERKHRHKPVGRRTHVLICLGCTIITIISAYGFGDFYANGQMSDPARLMVGVLTGIGFIGGGIIWKNESGTVQGITTAAEILLLAALGMAIGLGLYFLAATATVIGLLTLEGGTIQAAGKKLAHKSRHQQEQILIQQEGQEHQEI